jgi:hypothetical protein
MADMPDDIERLFPGPQTMASGDRTRLSSVVFFLDKVQEHLVKGDRDDRIVAIEIGSLAETIDMNTTTFENLVRTDSRCLRTMTHIHHTHL